MSKQLLDFVKKSSLFKANYVESQYQGWSEKKLQRELAGYRDYCLSTISFERDRNPNNLSILVEGFRRFLPDESLLKQCALYMENIIISDPLFEQAYPRNEDHQAVNALVGMKKSEIDRAAVASAVNYVKSLQNALKSEFVKLVPLSYLHEPPEEIPVFFPKNLFSDLLPQDLLRFFRSNAQVSPLYKTGRGWAIGQPKDLEPCRAISIHFGDDHRSGMIYFLNQQEITSFDEDTGKVEFVVHHPSDPPEPPLFENWINQSINKTAHNVFERVFNEIGIANRMKANYLTSSTFVADLLSQDLPTSDATFHSSIMNLVLDLNLPVLEGVSLDSILEIRQKDGEVFQNFRLDLETKLRTLRQIDDTHKLKAEIENVTHELSEVQVNEVNKKIAKIKRRMVSDVFILVGGLVTIIQAEGIGIPLLSYGMSKGYQTYNEYKNEIKENPAFFLWKLKERKGN